MPSNNENETEMYQDGRQAYLVPPRQIPSLRRAYRVKEVAEMLGLPRTTVYDLIRREDIRAVALGSGRRKIYLVTAEELDRVLHRGPAHPDSSTMVAQDTTDEDKEAEFEKWLAQLPLPLQQALRKKHRS